MDRITRKNLKTDKFAQEVTHGFEFLTGHSADIKRYGGIALAVILIGGGIYFWMHYRAGVREAALAQALKVDDGVVGAESPGVMHFNSEDEKNTATVKAYTDVFTKYRGTLEGSVAGLNLGLFAADHGDTDKAEKIYKEVADSAPKAYASLANQALVDIYQSQGRDADAEKLIRGMLASPTTTISKEQATIMLARLIGKKNPDEARRMLQPLATARTDVSKVAVQALADLSRASSR